MFFDYFFHLHKLFYRLHINAVLAACGFNLRKLYAVFFLPILKWLDNRITEIHFSSVLKLNDESLGFIQN